MLGARRCGPVEHGPDILPHLGPEGGDIKSGRLRLLWKSAVLFRRHPEIPADPVARPSLLPGNRALLVYCRLYSSARVRGWCGNADGGFSSTGPQFTKDVCDLKDCSACIMEKGTF